MKVCICGGGNIGHVIAGFVSAQKRHEVCILTHHPGQWSQDVVIEAPEGKTFAGHLNSVSSDVQQMVSDADIVLLCLPGYAIRETLLQVLGCTACKSAAFRISTCTFYLPYH